MMGIIAISDRASWLAERKRHLQASEAAAVLGCSPWMTADQLFDLKTGRAEEKDIGDNPAIQRGVASEPLVRALVPIDLPEMTVTAYRQYDIWQCDEPGCEFMGATLDGELHDSARNEDGILECKTGSVRGLRNLAERGWGADEVPQHYYVQILAQLACCPWARFVLVSGRLTCDWFRGNEPQRMPMVFTEYRRLDRSDAEADIQSVKDECKRFWGYVTADRRPPLTITTTIKGVFPK